MKAFHASVALHLISILLAISSANGASPLDTWVNYPRPMGMTTLNGVAFGNGLFVAVGNNGGIATSADGIEWTRQEAGTTYPLNGVKFVNGHFFALSGEYRMIPGPSLISTDGTNWTQGPNLSDVTYGNGFYVGLPDTRSATLEEWTTPERTRDLNIEFGNGVFLASGSESRYSPDGLTWTAGEKLSLNPDDRLAFANGLFLASGLVELPGGNPGDYRRTILYSTDGVNWEKSRPGSPSPLSRAAAGGGYYVTGASSGDENFTIYYTTNLANSWTSVPVTIEGYETNSTPEFAYGNSVFVATIGGKLYRSNPAEGLFPLSIHSQPAGISGTVGGTIEFFVGVQGSEPITYQWRKDGVEIAGATNQTLTLTNLTVEMGGEYDVVVSNPAGSVTSEAAVLMPHFADVQTYAGVTLRGSSGDKFLIEYQNAVDPSAEWHFLADVTLSEATMVWIDYDSADQPQRFYRATYHKD